MRNDVEIFIYLNLSASATANYKKTTDFVFFLRIIQYLPFNLMRMPRKISPTRLGVDTASIGSIVMTT